MDPRHQATRLFRSLLRRIYPFDPWHVGHADETYVRSIVNYLNAMPRTGRTSAIEIGCGLADILRRLNFQQRTGLDRDRHALSAARVLSAWERPKISFAHFEFPADRLSGIHDAIVLVNWIHAIEPDTLSRAIAELFEHHVAAGGVVVVDTVADPAYTYNHDIQRLAPSGAGIHHLGRYSRSRDVWALRKPLNL